MESLGAHTIVDNSKELTGSDTGNLIAKLPGHLKCPPIVFVVHMDTVEPGRGIDPLYENGLFRSSGDTVLGADDKSGVAILIEVARILQGHPFDHGPIEFVFTTCEEVGLAGSKHLQSELLKGRFGYALDTRDTDRLITRAPGANRFTITVTGKDAHAGAAPEEGINAIIVSARALATLQLGRIDDETTCNIGIINGGAARNIVPKEVRIVGEARSHDLEKLERLTQGLMAKVEAVVGEEAKNSPFEGLPSVRYQVEREYNPLVIDDDHYLVNLALTAAGKLGRELSTKRSGGGSDANVLFEKNIVLGILGTGMTAVHSSRETIHIEDMEKTAILVLEIIRLHAAGIN
jgi:tripeptide aminopeptidase